MNPDLLPFSAVVGQDEAKLALLLSACDRRVGGVLLRGEKGSAKSTLARGLAALLPGDAPFVELPIGATEDRVVGTLDLAAALTGGEKRFDPGLLASADRGVLYVDEINLLPDHLVDVLLDVSASGVNLVEREGVSHSHPSRFILVGSMNPEEGDLRPQLLDRFGLAVDMKGSEDLAARASALRRRLAFDHDPDSVRSQFASDDADLAARLSRCTPAVLPGGLVDAVAGLCAQVGAEGLRADLTICRAAAALAGWEGRPNASESDVRRVAHLALAHRARRDPLDPPGLDHEKLQEAMDEHLGGPPPQSDDSRDTPPDPDRNPGGPDGGADGGRDGGPQDRTAGDRPPDSEPEPRPPAFRATSAPMPSAVVTAPAAGRSSTTLSGRGRTVGDRAPVGPVTSVAVGPTVRRAAARMASMVAEPLSTSLVTAEDLREPVKEQKTANLVVLAVDASGSMGATRRMEAARAAVLGMLRDAYQRRDLVAVVAFRGEQAQVLLKPTGSVEVARARLAHLPTGGQTPLADGLHSALRVARAPSRAATHVPLLVVLTDGRATYDRSGRDPIAAALSAGRSVAESGVASVVIDLEAAHGGAGRPLLGLARDLARAMQGRYVSSSELTADLIREATAHAVGPSTTAVTSDHAGGTLASSAIAPDSTTTSHGAPGTS